MFQDRRITGRVRRGIIISTRTTREMGETLLQSCFTVPSASCGSWKVDIGYGWAVRL
jgi:hypothetical protein